jgi:hypothetical protein
MSMALDDVVCPFSHCFVLELYIARKQVVGISLHSRRKPGDLSIGRFCEQWNAFELRKFN